MWCAIKSNQKTGSAVKDLGCSIEEFKIYIESKFYNRKNGEAMTWENWTKDGWHMDHVIPLSNFNLTNREEFLKANHYSNLQPLWTEDHLEKTIKENKARTRQNTI